jgi:aminoglycoside 3-N-acetyltransferase
MGLLRYYTVRLSKKIFSNSVVRQFKQIQRKRETRLREVARTKAVARYGRFDANQLYQDLTSVGIRRGGVLMVHSSFGRFYNFEGTAEDILNILEDLVGPESTLMMPAHSHYRENGSYIFDVCKSPAHTGILCELLRRRPGTRRSLHPTHSVCAKGPLAETLLRDHHKDQLSCGPLSPYAKLAEYNGQILGLGLPPGHTTFLHVVEDIDLERYPRRMYLEKPVEFIVIDETGQRFALSVPRRDSKVLRSMNLSRVVRHLSERAFWSFSIRGIPAFLAHAKPLLEELRLLTDRGIIIYA